MMRLLLWLYNTLRQINQLHEVKPKISTVELSKNNILQEVQECLVELRSNKWDN